MAFAQAGYFFFVGRQLPFAGFAGFLKAGQPRRTVRRKIFAHRGQALQPKFGHAPLIPLPPDAQATLQQAALAFQIAFAAAQIGQSRLFVREFQGHAVKARAFRRHILNSGAQFFQLPDGRVQGGFAAVALENILSLAFQDFQRVAGRAQAGAEARAIKGIAHAFGAQAFKIFQFTQAEAEYVAVNLAADPEEQLPQKFRRQRGSIRFAQRQQTAARAGPPRQMQRFPPVRAQHKTAARLAAAQGGVTASGFTAAGIGIACEHGAQKFQTGGLAGLVTAQKDGQTRRQVVHLHAGENAEAVDAEGFNIHQRTSSSSTQRRSASCSRACIWDSSAE